MQTEASKEINTIFPDGLKSPVLHYVQFQDHHRMDDLGRSASYPRDLFIANMYQSQ